MILLIIKFFWQDNSTSDISETLVRLGKLVAKIAEIYNFCNETKSIQIKGDKQLAELTELFQHIHVRQIR